jgi:hypothetical protein
LCLGVQTQVVAGFNSLLFQLLTAERQILHAKLNISQDKLPFSIVVQWQQGVSKQTKEEIKI